MVSYMDQPLSDLGKSLLEAARKGDEAEVRDLLTKGASFTTDWLGTSPLHLAAQNGHLDTALLLMRAGMSWDAKTKVNKTPLHLATQYGHINLVRAFINQGADLNARDILNMTPLHWAAEKNYPDIAELLITNDVDINLKNKFDKTAIDICLENGYGEVLGKIKTRTQDTATPESLTPVESSMPDLSPNKNTDIISAAFLSNLSSFAGVGQDMSTSAMVALDELAMLQSTPLNLTSVPVENIRSIVLTDAGRLAFQLLNRGLDNTMIPCAEKNETDRQANKDSGEIVANKNDSEIEQNPEQFLTSVAQTIDTRVANLVDKEAPPPPVSDLFASSSSVHCLPISPVFPEFTIRNNSESDEGCAFDFGRDIMQKQVENTKHAIDVGENQPIMTNSLSGKLQVPIAQSVCKKL